MPSRHVWGRRELVYVMLRLICGCGVNLGIAVNTGFTGFTVFTVFTGQSVSTVLYVLYIHTAEYTLAPIWRHHHMIHLLGSLFHVLHTNQPACFDICCVAHVVAHPRESYEAKAPRGWVKLHQSDPTLCTDLHYLPSSRTSSTYFPSSFAPQPPCHTTTARAQLQLRKHSFRQKIHTRYGVEHRLWTGKTDLSSDSESQPGGRRPILQQTSPTFVVTFPTYLT